MYDRMTIFEDHLVRDINAGELVWVCSNSFHSDI